MKIQTGWEIGKVGMIETIMVVAAIFLVLGIVTKYGIDTYVHIKQEKKIKRIESLKTNFHVGDVVQTQYGWDRGLVTKVNEKNMPTEVMASYGYDSYGNEYSGSRYYGGVENSTWYKTGEHMTIREWYKAYAGKGGWDRYCRDRQNQVKIYN